MNEVVLLSKECLTFFIAIIVLIRLYSLMIFNLKYYDELKQGKLNKTNSIIH